MIALDDWTQVYKEDLFKLNEQRVLPYEEKDNVWVRVTIEMDLDAMEVSRHRYTAFDLLADVGGLSGMFATIFAIFMAIWNYTALDSLLMSHLYKVKKNDDEAGDELSLSDRAHLLPCTRLCMNKSKLRHK